MNCCLLLVCSLCVIFLLFILHCKVLLYSTLVSISCVWMFSRNKLYLTYLVLNTIHCSGSYLDLLFSFLMCYQRVLKMSPLKTCLSEHSQIVAEDKVGVDKRSSILAFLNNCTLKATALSACTYLGDKGSPKNKLLEYIIIWISGRLAAENKISNTSKKKKKKYYLKKLHLRVKRIQFKR